jgi:ABC-2 type transport system permease protein
MIATIARKEFTELWRDGRFAWTSAILVVLFIVALLTGLERSAGAARDRAAAEAETYRQWLEQGEKNPHAAAHYGLYAFKPETPLAYVDRGINDFAGTSIWLEAHYQNAARDRVAQDGNAVQRFGQMTAAFVLQYLMPLVIIILTFSAFAGERESGTLRQLLAIGVAKRPLLLGKTFGAASAVLVVIVPLVFIGSIVMASATSGDAGALLARAAALAILYVGYALIWLLLGLGISAAMRTAQGALITLVGIWAVTSFLVPRIATDVSRTLAPTPSLIAFKAAVDRDMAQGLKGETQAQMMERKTKETLEKYNVGSIRELPVNIQGLRFIWLEEWGDAVFDKHFGALYGRFERQERIQQAFGALSPVMAVRPLSMAIAGTDLSEQHRFAAAAERFRRQYILLMNEDMTVNSRTGDAAYKAGPELWSSVGAFRYEPPSLSASLSPYATAGLIGGLWLLGCVGFALRAVGRLSPEAA